MAHWSDRWLGRPFKPGEYDCLDFVFEVAVAQFGRQVAMPPRPRSSAREMTAAVHTQGMEYARPLAAGEAELEGDLVLLRPLGARTVECHVGILCLPAGARCVLHLCEGLGSVRYRINDLARRSWELRGLYRWL